MEFPINFAITYLVVFIFIVFSDIIIEKIKEKKLFKKCGKYLRKCRKCGTFQVKYSKTEWTSLTKMKCECNRYNQKID